VVDADQVSANISYTPADSAQPSKLRAGWSESAESNALKKTLKHCRQPGANGNSRLSRVLTPVTRWVHGPAGKFAVSRDRAGPIALKVGVPRCGPH